MTEVILQTVNNDGDDVSDDHVERKRNRSISLYLI